MNWDKLKPWNWFKKEQAEEVERLPARRAEAADHPLAALHNEVDRVFDSFLRGCGAPSLLSSWPSLARSDFFRDGFLRPSVDISENRKGYTIRVEIPGVEKEDVHLTVEDDTLVISGEKRQEKEDNEEGYHCVERSYGSFRRVISLPSDADQEKLDAKFRNGVLAVKLPRLAGARSNLREIAIGG